MSRSETAVSQTPIGGTALSPSLLPEELRYQLFVINSLSYWRGIIRQGGLKFINEIG